MNTATIQRYLLSSATTFITSFVGMLALELSSSGIQWTETFWISLLAVAGRAAVKAVVEGYAGQHADAPTV